MRSGTATNVRWAFTQKTPLAQPDRVLKMQSLRPPRQAGFPIKPLGTGCLWQRTCSFTTEDMMAACWAPVKRGHRRRKASTGGQGRRVRCLGRNGGPLRLCGRTGGDGSAPVDGTGARCGSASGPVATRPAYRPQPHRRSPPLGCAKGRAVRSSVLCVTYAVKLRVMVPSTLTPGPIVEEKTTLLT